MAASDDNLPALIAPANKTPLKIPPSVDAALYANVGRYAGAAVLTVFEQLGGIDGMTEWANRSPDNQSDFYTRIFSKVVSAPRQVEVGGTISIEQAIRALDMEEGTDYHVVSEETGGFDHEQF